MNNTRKIIENINAKDWYNLLLRKENYSHYIDRPIEHHVKFIKGELDELLRGVENNDKENIAEEIIDVVYNTAQLIQHLLKYGLIDDNVIKESGNRQYNKITKRQPQLKENYKIDTFEDEHNLFVKLKNQGE